MSSIGHYHFFLRNIWTIDNFYPLFDTNSCRKKSQLLHNSSNVGSSPRHWLCPYTSSSTTFLKNLHNIQNSCLCRERPHSENLIIMERIKINCWIVLDIIWGVMYWPRVIIELQLMSFKQYFIRCEFESNLRQSWLTRYSIWY